MIEPLLEAERLLLYGMLDQAEQIYRRVAEQDPRNSIAVVGLARIALERGDDQLALVRARAALEIDGQNAAAIRLEARLTEVIAERDRRAADEQRWASLPPAEAPEAQPSEQVVFTRNPSMTDHRRGEAEEQAQPGPSELASAESSLSEGTPRRPNLLRRLLRRRG